MTMQRKCSALALTLYVPLYLTFDCRSIGSDSGRSDPGEDDYDIQLETSGLLVSTSPSLLISLHPDLHWM